MKERYGDEDRKTNASPGKGTTVKIAPDPREGMTALQRMLLKALGVPQRSGAPSLSGTRILAVQIAGMGDFTLAVPAFRALRRANPAGKIDLLTSGKGESAAAGCPYFDTIDSLDLNHHLRADAHSSSGLGEIISLIRRIRRRRYDIAVNLMGLYSPHGAVRMGLFLRSLGIPLLAGRDTLGTGTFYHYAMQEALTAPRNERDAHLELIRHLGAGESAGDELEVWPDAEDERLAETIAEEVPGHGPLIGVNPGTDRPEKNWPEERFLEVMRALRNERGARFLLTGGPAEAGLTARLADALAPNVFDTVGKISYQGTAALMRRCDMILTSDTAALHLAWAAGVPAVALFRKENLGRYRPATAQITCLTGNEAGEGNSLDIDAAEVVKACLERLR